VPFASKVAVCAVRAVAKDPVEVNEPVPGSYNSADARRASGPPMPPVIRTLPVASKVAVCSYRGLDIEPVELNEPVPGSYSSADARTSGLIPPSVPPVIRTLPVASKVAVCATRAVDIGLVELNEPVPGSYSSADSMPSRPPVIKTLPIPSKVAVCAARKVAMDPVALNEPWGAAVVVGVGVGVGVGASVGVGVDAVVAAAVEL